MDLIANARIIFRASPDRAFESFANPEMMSRFWFSRRDQGLVEGDTAKWYVGNHSEAPAIDVTVLEIVRPGRIRIEWGQGKSFTEVMWTFEGTDTGDTVVCVSESGFELEGDELIARVLDSTAGFNQVLVAAKAMVEHGVELNVVRDHA